jgi:ABC-type bacteriocin/lantibiotic exporter with double-glycine peptidase domain
LSAIAAARGALGTALEIINKENQFDKSEESQVNATTSAHKDLTLQAISFAYPTRPNEYICNNFNLNIPAGQTIALVGASGSGKVSCIEMSK